MDKQREIFGGRRYGKRLALARWTLEKVREGRTVAIIKPGEMVVVSPRPAALGAPLILGDWSAPWEEHFGGGWPDRDCLPVSGDDEC